ncbi:uncharacterized protein MONOS_3550 [Monocercomonoides exilis]|uniref:uncharacterized protein n=1 Tax=Monocercomonoides exilis TaxID=2049356 RepID=UPI0035598F10|nr:hypothetical protein MONOS_3550 [Monocercomonoides exilis]|eukprot:MONOS_3550.1-p1 / transcript=MONOS_3550.1 / gene=MONOS_3550 / organism=Monocercomonoides_exilis_PA203 / gene_product=unspecified product / transcript_product=unspecified product / location=Mono_scaffold00084:66376-68495(-) / protein_length=568 / sequence_SO=supercontig / SO=protein_coding / is_pseudo=false
MSVSTLEISSKLSRDETLSGLGVHISDASVVKRDKLFDLMKETANLLYGIVRGTMKEEIEGILKEEYGMSEGDASKIVEEVVDEYGIDLSKKKGGAAFAFGKARTSSQANGKFSVPSAFSSKTASSSSADKAAPKPFVSLLPPTESSGTFGGPAKFPPSFGSAMHGPGPMLPTGLSAAGPFLSGISLALPVSDEPSLSVSSMAPPGFPAPGFPSSSFGVPLLMPPFNPSDESSPFIGTPGRLIEDGEKSQKEEDRKEKKKNGKLEKKSESSGDSDSDSNSDEESDDSEASEDESSNDESGADSSSSSSSEGGKRKEGYKENKKPVKGKLRGPLHFSEEETNGYNPKFDESIHLSQKKGTIVVNRPLCYAVCLGNPFCKGIWRVDLLVVEDAQWMPNFVELFVRTNSMDVFAKKRSSFKPKKSEKKPAVNSEACIGPFGSGWASSSSSINIFGARTLTSAEFELLWIGITAEGNVERCKMGSPPLPCIDSWKCKGSQIACEIDTKKKTLSFFVNRKKQALVITNVPKCVQFQLSLHAESTKIKVLRLDKMKKPTGPKKVPGTFCADFN